MRPEIFKGPEKITKIFDFIIKKNIVQYNYEIMITSYVFAMTYLIFNVSRALNRFFFTLGDKVYRL